MMKRFAILDKDGTVLNVVEFKLPLEQLPNPGYGKFWMFAEGGEVPAPPEVIAKGMKYLDFGFKVNPRDRVIFANPKVERYVPPAPPMVPKAELEAYALKLQEDIAKGVVTSYDDIIGAIRK